MSDGRHTAAAAAALELRFSADQIQQMRTLSAKAQAGSLSDDDQGEIDMFERLGCLLDILHSRARRVCNQRPQWAQ